MRWVIPDAETMADFGRRLAASLQAGDVLLLDGPLGAGKTTFTRGLGVGLQVRGPVTSPTFVIARVHPSLAGGPALVHVDAYRLGAEADLEALDLEAEAAEVVTVVEWGREFGEALAESHLLVTITRGEGGLQHSGRGGPTLEAEAMASDPEFGADGPRIVSIEPVGPRWSGSDLSGLLPDTP